MSSCPLYIRQIGGLKRISLIKFNDAMAGPSVGWKLVRTGGDSDFIGCGRVLGGIGFHQQMNMRLGKSIKVDIFFPVLKAFSN